MRSIWNLQRGGAYAGILRESDIDWGRGIGVYRTTGQSNAFSLCPHLPLFCPPLTSSALLGPPLTFLAELLKALGPLAQSSP